jgi:hypothetical protein
MEIRAQPDSRKQRDYYDELFPSLQSKHDWIQVTSNINRKPKVCNNNLIQLIPHTANKFETLTNLKEDSESSCAAYKKEESNNLRGHQIQVKKTQIVKSLRKGKHIVFITLGNKILAHERFIVFVT